jgi:hypothetical protein
VAEVSVAEVAAATTQEPEAMAAQVNSRAVAVAAAEAPEVPAAAMARTVEPDWLSSPSICNFGGVFLATGCTPDRLT